MQRLGARLVAVTARQILREIIRRPRLLGTLLTILLPMGAVAVWLHNTFLTAVLAVLALAAAAVVLVRSIPELRAIWFPDDRE